MAENKSLVVVVVVGEGRESTRGNFPEGGMWKFLTSGRLYSKEKDVDCCATLQLVLATLENLLLILEIWQTEVRLKPENQATDFS